MNSYINTKIELKNLSFHTKDKAGKSKCHWMHVGKENDNCPTPSVHGCEMEKVEEDLYLGDIVASNGKNKSNIESRISKGIGAISRITYMMEIAAFGNHTIEIGLMLRTSILINTMIFNGEIWYNLTSKDVKELDNVDRMYLNQLLECKVTTPKEAAFLELAIMPIEIILKQRRMNYLYYILTRKEKKLNASEFLPSTVERSNPRRLD